MPSQRFSLQDRSIFLEIIGGSIVDDIGMQTITSNTAEVSCCVLSGECNFTHAGKICGIPFAKPYHLLSLLSRNLENRNSFYTIRSLLRLMHIIVGTRSGPENTFPLVGERRLTHLNGIIGEIGREIGRCSNMQLIDTIAPMNGLVAIIIGRL